MVHRHSGYNMGHSDSRAKQAVVWNHATQVDFEVLQQPAIVVVEVQQCADNIVAHRKAVNWAAYS